jgi:1-acyl-sn-glycerol-3-phosphate acyltransferase
MIVLKKFLWILYQPYKWLIFIPLAAVLTLILGFLTVPLVYILHPKITNYLTGVLWARLLCALTPVKIWKKGRKNKLKKQSYVIVSNHSSSFDILVLYARLGFDFKWVMKKELRKVPGLGVACEKLGHIFIDRSSPKAALDTIEKAEEHIKGGTCVVFFPEGTRSRTGKMGEFKKGAYKLAFDLGLPILPVTIKGTFDILPTGSFNLFPGKVKLIYHKPIDIEQYSWEKVEELMNHTKEVLQSGLD